MTDHDTKQDHPGPEWVEFQEMADGTYYFQHPVLGEDVAFGGNCPTTRAEAIERCRAISAAALHWERVKADEWTAHFHNPIIGLINDLRSR